MKGHQRIILVRYSAAVGNFKLTVNQQTYHPPVSKYSFPFSELDISTNVAALRAGGQNVDAG
jgi:hypothetical protein